MLVPACRWEGPGLRAAGCRTQQRGGPGLVPSAGASLQVGRARSSANRLEGGLQNDTCQHKCLHGRLVERDLQNGCCQFLCPQGESKLPPAPLGGPLRSPSVSYPDPLQLLPLGWDSEHVRLYVRPLRVESPFPIAIMLSHKQVLLAFKAKFSGGSSFWFRTSRMGSLMWGSNPSLLGKNLCYGDYPPVCGSPTWQGVS